MKLSELADIQMGYPFRSRLKHTPKGDVVVLQMKDIDDANLANIKDAIRVALPRGTDRHLLRKGDLLFRSRGRSYTAALLTDSIGPAVLSAPMLLIRPHAVQPEYLCWLINAPATQAQLAAMAEGTSVQMISAETLRALDVPVPPATIQQRIVQLAGLVEQEQRLHSRIAAERHRLATHLLMQSAHEAIP
jgi:hypothetical protein